MLVPVEMEARDNPLPLCSPACALQEAAWRVMGLVGKGPPGDVYGVKAGGRACSPHLGTADQHFPEMDEELGPFL